MVLKNKDIRKNRIYFQSISDGLNTDSAYFTFKNSGSKTLLDVRTDNIYSESIRRKVNIPNINNINDNEFFHYVFTIKSDTSGNEIKMYINNSTTGSNKESLGTSLSGTLRQSNLIGTQKITYTLSYQKVFVSLVQQQIYHYHGHCIEKHPMQQKKY